MSFNTNKIETTFVTPITLDSPIEGRKYTLTHSDDTGMMFLTIANKYDYDAINKDLRDEIIGTWKNYNSFYNLFFYAYVGDLDYFDALNRYNIFKSHMTSALQSIFYGDRELLNKHTELLNVPIYVKFDSSIPTFNNYEFYGYVKDYVL